MDVMRYERLNETLYRETLPNGLELNILPKAGFQKTYAAFTAKYGSIDNRFRSGRDPVRSVPDGIAHFLEHKMFEEPKGDVFAEFASQGASANAFTTFDRTTYLFSATAQVKASLETLLNFVQNPYFTEENVEKEKGIIGQEIKMYEDNAGFQVYSGLLKALFREHPLHIPIAGTVESIAAITKDLLYDCYHTFYHPANMNLLVVGGIEPEEVLLLVKDNQAGKSFPPARPIERIYAQEGREVRQTRINNTLSVSLPKCLIGLKEEAPGTEGIELIRRECATKLMLDVILSPSSALYQALYDDRLITDSFGYDYTCTAEYAYALMGGDTPDPEALAGRLQAGIEKLKETGLPEPEFERCKRKRIGSFLRMLNSPEGIAYEFTRLRFKDADFFGLLDIYEGLTVKEAEERMQSLFNWRYSAVSTVTGEKRQ